MRNLLPIGRFSQVTRLSVRMLRHYDELGLLKPALVDEASGYRYYSLAQAAEAERIRLLRELEVPLEEIRELLSAPDARSVRERLERHKARLEAAVAGYRRAIAALEGLEAAPLGTAYPVRLRHEAAQPVLSRRLRGPFPEMVRGLGAAFAALYAALARQDLRPAGPPFVLYHGPEFDEEDLDYEPGLPTERLGSPWGDLRAWELPPGPVAYTLHAGPYGGIGRAYQAVATWMGEHGHEAAGPPREVYLVGQGQAENPAEYRTELVWPVR
ncbi:Multidrug-efflux transporter 1 regulator [Calidithermus terrae]|uniref:Multidrug-efflux transporter 1 regulator n=1 Tax=Calidithermus terrae TaxID=1408545 RepID=A0A399E433_9DEIN|nr:GyrI-like domain-containing protein [Calidithermus terrae]RIH77470.1 Multidrug-efflux transporter 1 regulator [Calidithermus terrae]